MANRQPDKNVISHHNMDVSKEDAAKKARFQETFAKQKNQVYAYPAENAGVPMVNFTKIAYRMPTPEVDLAKIEQTGPTSAGPSAISLFIPGGIKEATGAEWGPEDVLRTWYKPGGSGTFQGITADAISGGLEALKQGAAVPIATASAVKGMAQSPNSLFLFQKAKGFALQFNYEIVLVDPGEASRLITIANSFKASTLPSMGEKSAVVYLKYPDVWNIHFIGLNGIGNPVNGTGGTYKNMALVNCEVGYGDGVSVMVYNDKNPVKMSMSLSFQSIELAYQPL